MTTVATNQRWHEPLAVGEDASSAASWRVTHVSAEGVVGLTGPGPCRAYRYVDVDVLLRDWVLISDDAV